MTDAPCRTRDVSGAVWRIVYLTVTMGVEEPPIRQLVVVMAILVMPFEALLALDHLSTHGTPSVWLGQEFGA
jgi:hypothetical protein